MSTATLGGHRATAARLAIPAWGVPWGECTLDEEVTLSGRVELVIADLTVSCTVVSGGPTKGRSHYRVVAGAGGWGRTVGRSGHANDAGTSVASLLRTLATDAGETLAGDLPETRLGPSWARESMPAVRTLELLAPRGWYIDELGLTRIGRRPAAALAVEATRGPADTVLQRVTLAAESIATILPGVIVDGIEAFDVLHEVSGEGGLRSTIWGAGYAGGQLEDVMAGYILRVLPWLLYARGPVEYRVVDQAGERLTLQPIRVSLGMPDLDRIVMRPGVPGVRADVQLGSRVLVQFIEADPSRPVVTGFEDAEGGGFAHELLELSAEDDDVPSNPIGRVVRYGDSVTFSSPGPGVLMMGTPAPFSRVKG
jgi:hypothetical protein